MENNNDPSTGSGTNKNKKIEELTDEQLKEVAGGWRICPPILVCKTISPTTCECQECEDGFVLRRSSSGGQECVLNQGGNGIY